MAPQSAAEPACEFPFGADTWILTPAADHLGPDSAKDARGDHADVVSALAAVDPESQKLCILCEKPGPLKCAKCLVAGYCSAECQRQDWKHHKLLCAGQKDFTDETRPSPRHVRAIMFPMAESTRPRLIWIERRDTTIKLRNRELFAFLMEFEEAHKTTAGRVHQDIPITVMNHIYGVRGKVLGHGICMVHIGRQRQSTPLTHWINKSVAALAKGASGAGGCEPLQLTQHVGPILFFTFRVDHISPAKDSAWKSYTLGPIFEDITLRDIRHVLDCIYTNVENPCLAEPERFPHDMLIGLQIRHNLDSDCESNKGNGRSDAESIHQVAVTASTLWHEEASYVPFMLGLSWYLREGALDPFFLGARSDEVPKVPALRYLREVVIVDSAEDVKLRHFIFNSMDYTTVVHSMGEDIHPAHLLALNEYMDQTTADPESHPSKKGFESFWETFKVRPLDKGGSFADVPSPYEIKKYGECLYKKAEEDCPGELIMQLVEIEQLKWRLEKEKHRNEMLLIQKRLAEEELEEKLEEKPESGNKLGKS